MELRISGVVKESVVDGPGIRYVVFTQGCPHKCPGCHNPDTHDFGGGKLVAIEKILADIKKDPLLKGVTFSGGEPFLQAKPLVFLGKMLKDLDYDIITYTGYIYEDLLNKAKEEPDYLELLKVTDVLIDGPFILEQRDLNLLYRGSANQRIIDIPRSLETGETVVKN
ncbi:MAG: anaerobic ribonucleoside-triphosphate reductase activating protein [Bacillota bacterium]